MKKLYTLIPVFLISTSVTENVNGYKEVINAINLGNQIILTVTNFNKYRASKQMLGVGKTVQGHQTISNNKYTKSVHKT